MFPLIRSTCQAPLTFIALLTDPEPIAQILAHIGEPISPTRLHQPRGPPQPEFDLGAGQPKNEDAAQGSFSDDLDRTTHFDPAEPEPVPDDEVDQS